MYGFTDLETGAWLEIMTLTDCFPLEVSCPGDVCCNAMTDVTFSDDALSVLTMSADFSFEAGGGGSTSAGNSGVAHEASCAPYLILSLWISKEPY